MCEDWLFWGLSKIEAGKREEGVEMVRTKGMRCERTKKLALDLMIHFTTEAKTQNPTDPDIHYEFIQYLLMDGNKNALDLAYRNAYDYVQVEPFQPKGWEANIQVLLARGERDLAIEVLEHSISEMLEYIKRPALAAHVATFELLLNTFERLLDEVRRE